MKNGSSWEAGSASKVVDELRSLADARAVGARLPSTRDLQHQLGVGPVTVQRALARLVTEGVLVTRPGAGTFVAARRTARVGDTDWQQVALGASPVSASGIDVLLANVNSTGFQLGTGYLDAGLRADSRLAAAAARAVRRPDAWGTPPMAGVPELRSWFGREIGADPDQVLITSAAQSALSAVFRALLPAGSPVLCAVPTYPGALAVARSAGLVPVPVPTDADGIRPELLERALAATSARLLFLQPTFANPDGGVLAHARRREVLGICERAGAFILEDDYARWLGHGQVPPPPLWRDDDQGRVITVCSLTKILAPSLRIGAIVARGPVMSRLAAMRQVDDFLVPAPLQHTAVEMVTGPGWSAQQRAVSAALRARMGTLTAALAAELPECSFENPRGGISLWLRLPRGTDDLAVASWAARLGVVVMSGRYYVVGEQDASYLRLCVAGIREADIPAAVALLAEAVRAGAGTGTDLPPHRAMTG
ncbi:PLP-dependent aminotransferase family protein [Frankia sp. CNm7]|uniref:PLP-dependent aminotransferase family protein n=1 Tax=Frankia nepalensis TaxID=1836974 RepID=A0A937RU86_9ACTN|nr:PLP-dependent aminotransferase family protein [Frankia nepalensis]MBL7494999.1 PLP-dependent aminotransferase family protein [Frankia nepalensis]MBL7514690.1 PLP-dependent aminotransferase family protein [Frankia nepalensis]MBL7519577.1 PLP-dependent aminotransferase family protein [Frankia nepalensis]MBL7631991.1 PLP-dependent aminotransferase family protein [Frankia nepalensis]